MQKRLFRPTGCGVPLALMFASLAGQHTAAISLAIPYLIVTLLSLAAAETQRRTAAQLASHRQVLGTSVLSLVQTALAGGILIGLAHTFVDEAAETICWCVAATALVGMRCLEELAHAENDALSGGLADFLAGLAVVVPMLLFDAQAKATMIAAGIVFAVAMIIILLLRREKPEWAQSSLRSTIGAMVREGAYPLAAALLWGMMMHGSSQNLADSEIISSTISLLPGFFAGLAIVSAGRTAYRRDERESGAFHIALVCFGLVLAICAALPPIFSAAWGKILPQWAIACADNMRFALLGVTILMAQYIALRPRYIASLALYIVSTLSPLAGMIGIGSDWVAAAWLLVPTLVALGLSVPDVQAVARHRRAKRIRRRAQNGRL